MNFKELEKLKDKELVEKLKKDLANRPEEEELDKRSPEVLESFYRNKKIVIPEELLLPSRRIGKTRDLLNDYFENRKKEKKFKIELTEAELASLALKCGGYLKGSNTELVKLSNRAYEYGILAAANKGFKEGGTND